MTILDTLVIWLMERSATKRGWRFFEAPPTANGRMFAAEWTAADGSASIYIEAASRIGTAACAYGGQE